MDDLQLYREHLATLDGVLTSCLERAAARGLGLDGVVLHAGRLETYHADDHPIAFHSTPHFRRWVPLDGPEHLVLASPAHTPRVIRVRPRDFWYDTSPPPRTYWQGAVDFDEVETFAEAVAALGLGGGEGLAFIGACRPAAAELGIPGERVEPEALMAPLDWYRATKTPWEVSRLRLAAERGAEGHRAAREVFLAGGSELEIHWAFLEGSGHVEKDLPFEAITALDEKAAVLHYQYKRGAEAAPGKVGLIDAGGAHEGYASDVTRTWVRPDAEPPVEPVFEELLAGMDRIERRLVAEVRPARPYVEIHRQAHRLLAELMADTGLLRGDAEEACERGVTRPFLPHGVGHHLGIQVHDVGGHQAGPDGGEVPPPEEYPLLRNTRILEPGHVVTIEPGIYFIPMLLEPLRQSAEGELVDWGLVERLTDHGGIRIEDDVLCTEAEPEDLTRHLVPGPRGE